MIERRTVTQILAADLGRTFAKGMPRACNASPNACFDKRCQTRRWTDLASDNLSNKRWT